MPVRRTECRTEKFIKQKLDYIHRNPCRTEPELAVLPEDMSTVRQGRYEVMSYTGLQDVDLIAAP